MILGIAAACVLLCESPRAQVSIGAQGPEEGPIRRQAWIIPAHDRSTMMRTSLYRPQGAGPFPLVVVNHGSSQNAMRRAMLRLPEYTALVQWFVAHGYAVAVPQRPGHGETGGPYYEDQGSCAAAQYREAGIATAGSIAMVVEYLTRQPFVQKNRVIVVGQSAGGWGALALATRNLPAVKAVIAFAPGRGGRIDDTAGRNCAPDRLIAAAREYGEKSRVPTLWIYAENDSYFAPPLSRKLFDAFRLAGGRAEYHLLPSFGDEGHELVHSPDAVALWGPLVERFLAGVK